MSLQQFLQNLKSITQSKDNGTLTKLNTSLSIDLTNFDTSQFISKFQLELQGLSDDDIVNQVESQNFFDGDWVTFNSLVISYIKLVRDVDPSSLLQSHDLILIFYNDLTSAFLNNQFGALLSGLLYDTTRYTVPLMIKLDKFLNSTNSGKLYKRLIFISTQLSKIFNHIRSLKSNSSKQSLILFIVNNLNKVYFIIGNPLLCSNIFTNMNLLDLKFSKFSKFQQLEYRYTIGRYYLSKNQLFRSYHHLNWCFTKLNKSDQVNRIKVLRFLIPVSILVGKLPNKSVLSQYQELNRYISLVIHLQNGNYLEFQYQLFQNQQYFQSKGLLILLVTRSKVLIFRNLLNKILIWNPSLNYRFNFDILNHAFNKSIQPQRHEQLFGNQHMYQLPIEINDSFVENAGVSIITNGLMKGNVLSKARYIILSKKDSFPHVFDVYEQRFGTAKNERWMDI